MEVTTPSRRKGRRTASWILALGLALLFLAGLALRERMLVEWCHLRITDADQIIARNAVDRLARVRSVRAAEGLLKGLEHDALGVRLASADGLGAVGTAARAAAIDNMGDRARAAVPGLLEALKDSRSREARIASAEALAGYACDDEAVRIALIGTAENDREDLGVRVAALEALDCSGIDLATIVPNLLALAEAPEPLGTFASRILRDEELGGKVRPEPRR